MKLFLVYIFCIVFYSGLFSQNSTTVNLMQLASSKFFKLVNGTTGLYMYDVNESCMAEFKTKIKFPQNQFIPTDTAYAEITKKSTGIASLIDQVHLLIYNYKSYKPIIYASSTFDFSNENSFQLNDKNILKIPFKTNEGTIITYYLKMDTTKSYIEPTGKIPSSDCKPIDLKYTISLQNDFAKVGDWKNLSIALYDANQNSIFNEKGVDQLFVGLPGERFFLLGFQENQTITGCFIKDEIIIGVGEKKFEISVIDRTGNYIIIKPCDKNKTPTIVQFDALPNLTVQLADGDSLNLRKLIDKKKYLYVEIWTKSCPGCIQQLSKMDLIGEKYKSKLNIVGLYDKGDVHELKELINKYNIKNKQALTSKEINYNFSQDGYPYGLFFSKEGKLISSDMDLKKLIEFLDEN